MIARDFPGAPSIPADALAARLDGPDAPLLLDVRQEEEYAVSHLPGARRVEPEAEALPPELLALPRDTPIVAYCSVGYRSAALVERLRAEGFTRAENLEGSIFRWANEGRPVVRDGREVAEVHPYGRAWGVLLDRGLHAWRPEGG
jgi:rhodanese-related sulfurtransferase